MNLVSCDGCGIVLDKDKLKFPTEDELYDEDSYMKGIWHNHRFVPFVPCPVCNEPILENQ